MTLLQYETTTTEPEFGACYRAVHIGDWLFIHYLKWGETEVYNMKVDPYQMRNLVADPAAQHEIAALRAMLHEKLAALNDDFLDRVASYRATGHIRPTRVNMGERV